MKTTTSVQEDYLRAIYLLALESDDKTVKVTDLPKKLNLSKSTITQRLKDLAKKGWIEHERYGPVRLTRKGWMLAENVTYKHRIIEMFLYEVLHVPKSDVHAEAHKLEHAVSDSVIQKMAAFLNDPKACPHGTVLPTFHTNI